MSEMWKNVEEYSKYQVSNHGRIKSFKRYKEGKILKIKKNNRGYRCVSLYKNNKGKPKSIHIIVYETFNNYKLKKDECVHHDDENKENNYINNLIKMTKSEHNNYHNNRTNSPNLGKRFSDKIKKLMSINHYDCRGENNPRSILTNKKVIEIRKCLNENILTQTEIGKLFGVSRLTISAIKNNRVWTHI